MTAAPAKGPAAFRTISEAAAELDVPQHVLRFWETRFAFIRPMKRAGGRRFYRPQDLDVLRGVRVLLQDEGYTIKGVQKLHREQGLKRLVAAAGVGEAAAARVAAEVEAAEDEEVAVETQDALAAPRPRRTSAAPADDWEDEEEDGPETGDLFADLPPPGEAPSLQTSAALPGPVSAEREPAPAAGEAAPASEAFQPEPEPGPEPVAESHPEPAPTAPAPRSVLDPAARTRLTDVLRDLEITKAGIDALLGGR